MSSIGMFLANAAITDDRANRNNCLPLCVVLSSITFNVSKWSYVMLLVKSISKGRGGKKLLSC